MHEITHSGHTWELLGRDKFTTAIWPIGEYLARRKHGENVAERIARLNPNGKSEGERPKGWHPTYRASIFLDVISVSEFCKRHGTAAYHTLPKSAFKKLQGRKKAISGLAYAELGFRNA